ncbi:MAG TPA: CdaR family protein [Thermoanaerobaculia bacterium]|jgi:YbbR domain-containing protein
MKISTLFLRNPGTKLLALAIACVTCYLLTGEQRERISERSYRIPLSIVNIPTGTIIVSPVPDGVDVRVRGSFTALRQLEPAKLEAVVDLLGASQGEKRYPLAPEDINVPRGVEVIAIAPPEIRLSLDAVADRVLPIVPEVTGTPANGSQIEEIVAEPRSGRVQGPARTLARLTSLRTEPVSVDGREASFTAATTVAAQPAGVRVREGQLVTVRVRLRPSPTPLPTAKPRPAHREKP